MIRNNSRTASALYPRFENPKQTAVVQRQPLGKVGLIRRLNFQVQQYPLRLAGSQLHLDQQVHRTIALTDLAEDLTQLFVRPLRRMLPINGFRSGGKILFQQRAEVASQSVLPGPVIIAVV